MFPFESIAAAFRVIDQAMDTVIVPWRSGPDDHDVEATLDRIASMERPRQADLRRLQQYIVPIPRAVRRDWLASGVLYPVHERYGDSLLRLADLAHYDAETGLDIGDPTYRDAEANVF